LLFKHVSTLSPSSFSYSLATAAADGWWVGLCAQA
jgi:hypothetical protein